MKDFTQFTYHVQFEPDYDETPVIRVYENYLDFDQERHTDFEQIVDRYHFTDDDVDYALAALGLDCITDLSVDEYLSVYEIAKHEWIKPEVVTWVENHYEAWAAAFIKEVVA